MHREPAGTKSAAINLYHKRKAEALHAKKFPESLRKKTIYFKVLADDCLAYAAVHNKRSYRSYEQRISVLKDWFGNRPAELITPKEIESRLKERKWKPATFNRYRNVMSLAYRLGIDNEKVACNPARKVKQLREDNIRIRFLSNEEEQKLRAWTMENCPLHLPEMIIATHTGMRRSEQYGRTWEDVDMERGIVTLPAPKNGEMRHIPLNPEAMSAFRTLHEGRCSSEFVFLSSFGMRLMSPRVWFEDAVKACGLKGLTWHCLRHTFASRLVMAGVDLRTVQELLGHKTLAMTLRYSHLAPEHNRKAVMRLCDTEQALKPPTDTKTDTNAEMESKAQVGRTN